MRDSQMSKVYKAENESICALKKRPMTKAPILKFIERVCSSGYYRDNGGYFAKQIELSLPKGDGDAEWFPYTRTVHLPLWARSKEIILHELSHSLCELIHEGENVADHGKEFCTIYLNMVHCYLSKKKAEELEEAFTKNGIKYTRSKLNF